MTVVSLNCTRSIRLALASISRLSDFGLDEELLASGDTSHNVRINPLCLTVHQFISPVELKNSLRIFISETIVFRNCIENPKPKFD